MQLPGRTYSILTGGETEEQRQRQIWRDIQKRYLGNWMGGKCGVATVTYPVLSPQTPPWSQGES